MLPTEHQEVVLREYRAQMAICYDIHGKSPSVQRRAGLRASGMRGLALALGMSMQQFDEIDTQLWNKGSR